MSAADLHADQAARERAVDPTRSVILQAPAGSGKTSVLIERLLVLLAQADAPEEILAITFTRKAAAEMAARVAQALTPRGTPPADVRAQRLERLAQAVRERSAQRGWQLEENPGRLRILTIDALNRALAVQMPLAARAVGSLPVHAQPQLAYRLAARRTLLDAQSDPVLRPDVQLLFERMENHFGNCEALIAGMLAKRTHWLPHLVGEAATQLLARVQDSVATVVAARLARAQSILPPTLVQEGLAIGAEAARHLQSSGAMPGAWRDLAQENGVPGGRPPTLRQWQALAAQSLTAEGGFRKRLTVREGFPKDELLHKQRGMAWIAELACEPGALELLNELRQLPDPTLSADETQALAALARLLQLSVAELQLVFAEFGRVDYPGIAAAARAALGGADDPTDLALRLDTRLRHILVDEFQDTSVEQTQLLSLLTAGWERGDGRTVFVVGDPMQSIYGFREAEVGMFLGARATGLGGVALEALSLRRNFRSIPALVAWNNAAFAQCFPPLDDPRHGAVAYAPSLAARGGAAHGAVHLHRFVAEDLEGEARAIAQVISRLRAAQPAASIAVLLSARTHAAAIVAALEAAQVTVAGVELVPLAQLSIVRDLGALTQALDHLGDRTAWLALLRAPWCGLALADITLIAGDGRGATLWERLGDPAVLAALTPSAQERVSRLREVLAVALEEASHTYAAGRESLARRVQSAWLRLGGPAACAQAQDLEHARAYFEALEQWCAEPDWRGPQQLQERLSRLFAAHASHGAHAVQVMTIHRAKGLEFDHVILPGLGRARRGEQRPLLQWLELPREGGGADLLMAAVPPAAAKEPAPLGRYIRRLQEQRARNEATRLLYVAATRARESLHLFGQLDDPTDSKPDPQPRSGTLLERLWPALQGQFPPRAAAAGDTALPHTTSGTPRAPLQRLSDDWHLPALPPGPQPRMLPIAAYEAAPVAAGEDTVERAVCEILRSLARRRRVPPRTPDELEPQMNAQLQQLGCPAEELPRLSAAGVDLLAACLQDARLQWIYASLAAPDAQAEAPLELTGLFAGRLSRARADLSFKDAAGTRWLIDIAPWPPGEAAEEQLLQEAFAVRVARQIQLAGDWEEGTPARAAIYLPARQLFWTGSGD